MVDMKQKGFYRGINFGGWMSQCDYSEDRLNNFIKEEDFETVAKWGLDHIRIPFDYNVLENEDGSYNEEGFARLERAAALAKKNGLNVVLDLHKTAGFSFDAGEAETGFFENEKYQDRFYALWEQVARRFGGMSDYLAFELLNEVTDQKFITEWNRISNVCIEKIRKWAPDTIILVGSYWNNSPEAVKDLASPYDDKVVYNFHCYSPLEFTHQGAPWVPELPQDRRMTFAESGVTAELFENLFTQAIEKAKSENCGVYCGEYGVIDRCDPEEALKWFEVINSVFEKYGIARSVWSFREMDFGISDARMDGVRDRLLKFL